MVRRALCSFGLLALGLLSMVGNLCAQDVALQGEAEPQVDAARQFVEKMVGVQPKSSEAIASCTKGTLTLGHSTTAFLGDSGSCYQSGVWLDLWAFSASASSRVRVSFSATRPSLATIQDYSSGAVLAASNTTCGGLASSCAFEHTLPYTGQYFLGFGSGFPENYTLTVSLVTGGGGGAGVNLVPYKPSGWSDKIVVSTTAGTHQDAASFEVGDLLYLDFAVANLGTTATTVPFAVSLQGNGQVVNTWHCDPPLNPNSYCYVEDVVFSLEAGTYTFSIEADPGNVVAESNDGDNTYSRTITVGAGSGGTCTSSSTALCLNANRFAVSVTWWTTDGRTGQGQAVRLTSDTGYFWFFNTANVELCVKILDARGVNSHFWVFYGALSNVHYSIVVTDTLTGTQRTYTNPQGTMASVGDTSAFWAP
jgi:hypothetical protein